MKRQNIYLPLLFALILILGIFVGRKLPHPEQHPGVMIYPRESKLDQVLQYIQLAYVDSVNLTHIEENAIPTILENLDPHSVYIPARQVQQVNEPLEGNFDGIGVSFNMPYDTVIIITVIAGGPSEKVGIRPGDRIITINDSVVAGRHIDQNDIVKMLKGPRGTSVRVGIQRKNTPALIDFNITRDKIPLKSVDVAYMISDSTGFIKISKFARTTAHEFEKALEDLESKGMDHLILDLRGNSGGYLDAAINVANQLLDKGTLIVYTQGRTKPKEMVYAKADGLFTKGKLVVLIDEWSASASEIVAGAIQDNDRGTIIGRRSFGKGLVQEPFILQDGSVLRLTVARYYTPTGRCIQKPYTNGIADYYQDIHERFVNGEFEYADSIHFPDSLRYTTPGGKTVYGGGGIMPDIFVPMDTTGITDFFVKSRNLGLIYRFALSYTDQYREQLSTYKKVTVLNQFLLKQNLFNRFLVFTEKNGIHASRDDIQASKNLIETQIRAYIARNILDNDGFYPIIQEVDKTLLRAISYMNRG
ncbi:MAG: S41 family peptidase [Chlorobi bacterium]|nr:S41 family peptidase [Chlorobiota bacterium]